MEEELSLRRERRDCAIDEEEGSIRVAGALQAT